MITTWYVLYKNLRGTEYFMDADGNATVFAQTAEVFPMSDSLRDTAKENGYVPVPADFFGIEV